MLNIRHLSKSFSQDRRATRVLENLSLDIRRGEIFTLLGASGCGKTTLLRLVAGLEMPDAGQIVFGGQTWADPAAGIFVPPQKRHLGLVFQSYAVWPHLNVFDNVAYPLRNQRLDSGTIRERVLQTLDSVGLAGFGERFSHQLSGGQQQRVAMARALVGKPQLLLLDEPFSNLDVGLRQKLRLELRELQQRLGLTVILVTHDQDDAFALSDRIALITAGRIEQIGTAEQLHDQPVSSLVHDFVGKSSRLMAVAGVVAPGAPNQANLSGDVAIAHIANATLGVLASVPAASGAAIVLHVRPDSIRLTPAGPRDAVAAGELTAEISHNIFSGDRYETHLRLDDGQQLMAYQPRGQALLAGERAHIVFTSRPVASLATEGAGA